ncbi:FAD-dependent oxidoreductase [Paenibacillus sp. JX-17]|uniref:Glycerol-3-phosphate dehydrogenase n=2 Tax=Paenibacillus lacisoli TaxID=3064525 RepID=A0ABT9CFK9_9BACL|nr:FAD-dependent oxidoreductase [Paenibacillus sp. JX-17]MDO7906388.1 FAD-dependent oxidoreductase [Paenibacillus sp. JX-17]
MWDHIERETFDILVIGGGITGAGIALDAAARGLKVALVEMQDFAAGTSSRSTKLVHGGLRYLKQLEVGMVAEVGRERAVVYENGPHVTTPERMLLPFHQGGTFGRFSTALGLLVYDRLAGVKLSERRRMLSAEETLKKEPLLKRDKLKGGGSYVEYRTDDARLTLEVIKEAAAQGAVILNYATAGKLLYQEGRITGVVANDLLSGRQNTIRANLVINATGPWVDDLRKLDGSRKGKTLQLTKGVHLVIDQSIFPLRQAVYFDTPDGRMVFAIPRDGKTYVGTTDTVYTGDQRHPRMTSADRQYILDAVHYMFPDVRLTEKDVESSWAGVRPLIHEEGKGPSEISRKDEIWQSPSGLITIAGGKLTGYRKMAEMVMDLAAERLKREYGIQSGPCVTRRHPISGGSVGGSQGFKEFISSMTREGVRRGLAEEQARAWACFYGSNVTRLFNRLSQSADPGPSAADDRLPESVRIPLLYAMEEEMAVTPADFFIRRTGALFFRIDWVRTWKEPVIAFMAAHLGWNAVQTQGYKEELERYLLEAVVPEDVKTQAVQTI